MQRILVPTDFSPTAEKAFIFAVELARKSGGSIVLYHGYTTLESNFVATVSEREEYNRQTQDDIIKKLQRLRKKIIADDTGILVTTVAGESPLIDNLLAFIHKNKIDLVVMGTQGASGIRKALIGSFASRMIDKTEIPLLLIPEKYEWSIPEKILFTTNYMESDNQAISVAIRMAALFDAIVTIAHLYEVYFMNEEKERAVFDTYTKELIKKFPSAKMNVEFVVTASITDTMEKLYSKIPYDIMAMMRRKKTMLERFFIKSFTKNMAYITEQPLLIIPEK